MRKKIIGLATTLAFGFCAQVMATPITQTYEADIIAAVKTNLFAFGDVFSWTVTYDNSSKQMHEYSNGADGKANTADDYNNFTWNLPDASAYFFSDAVFDFGFTSNDFILGTDLVALRDTSNISYSRAYDSTGALRFDKEQDEFTFRSYDTTHGDDTTGFITVDAIDASGRIGQAKIVFGNLRLSPTAPSGSVPAPTTLALLGLGLVGLTASKRRKL